MIDLSQSNQIDHPRRSKPRSRNLLVFTGAVGYQHESIAAGSLAIARLADEHGFQCSVSDSAKMFNERDLASAAAVVWMQTSGTGNLNEAQRRAYERFTARGGGFVGVHAASDAERDWPLFDRLVGARFLAHPAEVQRALLRSHAQFGSNEAVPSDWWWTDEWYSFERLPGANYSILLSVDESTYTPGDAAMGPNHPISWRTRVDQANAWYTALGHDPGSFSDPTLLAHLWGGIRSVLPIAPEEGQ